MTIAPMYDCPNCGEVWRVNLVEFDCGEDDTIQEACCQQCGKVGLQPKTVDHEGKQVPVCHAMSDDEIREEIDAIYCDDWEDDYE